MEGCFSDLKAKTVCTRHFLPIGGGGASILHSNGKWEMGDLTPCPDPVSRPRVHRFIKRSFVQMDPDWLPEARKRKYNWDRKSLVLVKKLG